MGIVKTRMLEKSKSYFVLESDLNYLVLVLALMRHMRCLNEFYYPTDDRNMKAKLFKQKCKDD